MNLVSAIDDVERVVDVPAAQPQPPGRDDSAPIAITAVTHRAARSTNTPRLSRIKPAPLRLGNP